LTFLPSNRLFIKS